MQSPDLIELADRPYYVRCLTFSIVVKYLPARVPNTRLGAINRAGSKTIRKHAYLADASSTTPCASHRFNPLGKHRRAQATSAAIMAICSTTDSEMGITVDGA